MLESRIHQAETGGPTMRLRRFMGMLLCRIFSLVVIACYMAGCSLFGPTKQSIDVRSNPPEAQVLVNGKPMGITPLRFDVDRRDDMLLEIQKSGYHREYRKSSSNLSGLGLLDVVSGFFWLIPFVGLTSSAAWQHDPADFEITLLPEKSMTPTP